MRLLKYSLGGAVAAFLLGCAAYLAITALLTQLVGQKISAFAAFFRMFLYHWEYWYQYDLPPIDQTK